MSISSHSPLDQTNTFAVLGAQAPTDPDTHPFSIEPEALAHVVEVAAHVLATQRVTTLQPSSRAWETNVQLTLQLPDGIYVGDVQNGEPHGRGTMDYYPALDRRRYEGEWRDGEFHGKGILIYSNGDEYEGEWQNGLFHGNGIFKNGDGLEIREGKWQFGHQYGPGKRKWYGDRGNVVRSLEGNFVAGYLDNEEYRLGAPRRIEDKSDDSDVYRTDRGAFREGRLWEGESEIRMKDHNNYTYTNYTCPVRDGIHHPAGIDLGCRFFKSLCACLCCVMYFCDTRDYPCKPKKEDPWDNRGSIL